ncbi:hypothetical protein APHAL10511_002447 [Amanita phalloides]|nr:hypothetical protein APHAL10511_002447 [Amanita phalloides]
MSALARVQRRSLLLPRFQPTSALSTSNPVFTRLVKQSSTRAFSPTLRFFSTALVSRNDSETDTSTVIPSDPCRTLFVVNVPSQATVSEVQGIFWRFGRLSDFRMGFREGSSGVNKGFAHVQFAELEGAIAAYESHQNEPLWIRNRPLVLNYARPRKTPGPTRCNTLYFKEFEGGMMALQNVLKKYARHVVRINYLQPMEQGTRHTRGRIHFRSEAIATEALKELNGKVTENGVEIKLSYLRFKTQAQPSFQS